MDRRVKERLVGASILAVLLVLIVPELLSGPAPAPVRARLPATAPEPVRNVTVDLSTSKPQAQDPADAAETAAPTAQPPDVRGPGAANAAAGADASTGSDTDIASNAAPPPGTAHEGIARESTGRQDTGRQGTGRQGTAREGMSPAGAPPAAALPRAVPNAPLEAAPPASAPSATAPKSALSGHAWAVQLGSFASRANAEKLVRQLKAQGFSVYLVSGGSGHSLRYRVRVGPMADRGAATQVIAKLKSLGQGGSLVPPAH
jgi:DedD protein